ncbi:MAG: family 10 glycosylhydrolase [Bacteroidota bacterium]
MDTPRLPIFFCLLLCLPFWSLANPSHPPKHEFRAVWVATFHNIDWPSAKGLPVAQQKREFLELIQRQKRNGMNALVVQIRPCGDAFYRSKLAPWSEYLSGTQGVPPENNFDPLAFMVRACHENNMEFHAWMNPFRAISHLRFSSVADYNPARVKPEWTVKHGERLYFNPGLPAVQQYLTDVVMEVIQQYDVDGIHFDDYFYPYQESGKYWNDQAAFERFGTSFKDVHAWRRHNVDSFVKSVADGIKAKKPHVKFGISPIGIWRNKSRDPRGSNTSVSHTSYDMLYADVRKWLELGWIDYVAPQLYWSTTHPSANYRELIYWWNENGFNRHVYIGHAMFKVKKDQARHWKNPMELHRQLELRQQMNLIQGGIFYSENSFQDNPYRVSDQFQKNYHKLPALIPPMNWKDSIPPQAPRNLLAQRKATQIGLKWDAPEVAEDGESATYYIVYRFGPEENLDRSNPRHIFRIQRERYLLDQEVKLSEGYTYLIAAVDRMHNESEDTQIAIFPPVQVMAAPIGEEK